MIIHDSWKSVSFPPPPGSVVEVWLDASRVTVRVARYQDGQFIDTGEGSGTAGKVLKKVSSWRNRPVSASLAEKESL